MQIDTRDMGLCALAIAAGLALSSCSSAPAAPSPEDEFALAQEQQTIVGWQVFLQRHGGTEFEARACEGLRELEEAARVRREEEQTRAVEDEQAWGAAGSGASLRGCLTYLASHPEGSHAQQAHRLGAALVRAVVDGAEGQTLPGDEFPYGDFEAEEVLLAMGIKNTASATRSTLQRTAGSSEVVTVTTAVRVGWMNGTVSGLRSGGLVFLQEKTEILSGLIIDVEDSPAADDSTKGMRIHGTGYAIVDFDGAASVYEFE